MRINYQYTAYPLADPTATVEAETMEALCNAMNDPAIKPLNLKQAFASRGHAFPYKSRWYVSREERGEE